MTRYKPYIRQVIILFALMLFLPLTTHAQPLDIRLGKIYIGENGGDLFSAGIGAAGDINGDGYKDFLIGAKFWLGGQSSAIGRAYVYLGGDTLPDEPALILEGESIGQAFGVRVAGIGDINGDGFDDFAVSSVGEQRNKGAVYVYLGGDRLSNQPVAVLRGDTDEEIFGKSLAGGDINGDGYSDLIVGAPWSASYNPPGLVFVYFGGETFDTDYDWISWGLEDGMSFGWYISSDDINGDEINDIVVVERDRNSDSSLVHIFFGGDTIGFLSDVKIVETQSSGFGIAMTTGDINGDSVSDIVVYDHGNLSQKIYFGGVNFDSIVDDSIITEDIGSSIGNVNMDAAEDLILGNANRYRVRVFRGGSQFDHTPDYTVHMGSFSTGFGRPVALGDVNGDGAGDFLVAEPWGGDFWNPEGQAYVFLGDTTPVVSIKREPELLPRKSVLLWAYPNPFNVGTEIFYTIPETDRVVLKVYNIKGEEVKTLIDSIQARGRHSAVLRSEGLGSGIYFVRLETPYERRTTKLLLVK